MKMSFSLSSLQPSEDDPEDQRQARAHAERQYNSLTKKRKDPKQTHCQRSWTSREDCKDDFWAAIRSNYDYIMDTNLIEDCKEASGELIWDETDVSTQSWSLKEVSCQFSELYSWLRVLQELVYSKEENFLDKSLRAAHMEELRRRAYRRKLFNEQAGKLVTRVPALKDEVAWRVDHLNAKWELVEQMMAPIEGPADSQQDVSADFEHEVKCLRKWLREMECRLQPLSFNIDWTRGELEEKAVEHMVLQRDIEVHGRIVSSIVKLSQRVAAREEQRQQQKRKPQALIIATSLERRWHLLFLRALEWQCHIETLVARLTNKSGGACRYSSESDEEPVKKQPRLSRRRSSLCSTLERIGSRADRTTKRPSSRRSRTSVADSSDSDASIETKSNDEGSYFEDELCELCVMDEKSTGAESSVAKGPFFDNETAPARRSEDGRDVEVEIEGEDVGDGGGEGGGGRGREGGMPPTPNTVPTGRRDIDRIERPTEGLKRRRTTEEIASFNTSDRKSKNCATFYFKHHDTDTETDNQPTQEDPVCQAVDDSSEDEWTYTPSRAEDRLVSTEKRKTNVLVRLDLTHSPSVERSENISFRRSVASNVEEQSNAAISATTNQQPDDAPQMETADINDHNMEGESNSTEPTSPVKLVDKNGEDTRDDKTSIRTLILEVEQLVREERRAGLSRTFPSLILEEKGPKSDHRAKYARIREWLKLNASRAIYEGKSQPLDSCDASGEYTTEESDGEKHSVSSEDLKSSIATYRRFVSGLVFSSHSMSQEILEDAEKTLTHDKSPSVEASTPKVTMRTRRRANGPRPWSVSCISQIGNRSEQSSEPISQFSISETALHQLIPNPPIKSVSLDATGSRKSFNNSTSTLLEESIVGNESRTARNNNSLRRKKSRLRKKALGRKSESSSDGVHGNQNSGGSDSGGSMKHLGRGSVGQSSTPCRTTGKDCQVQPSTLVKSGSFSGSIAHPRSTVERAIVSDPSPFFRLPCCVSVPSTSETEEEECVRNKSCAPYDEILGSVLNGKDTCDRRFNNDSDVEMNSLGNNSFSEQAWDNYQEKYMSEPYSEVADVETARRLLDFGDDYRNFLDSQSDCASSMSAVPGSSPPMPRSRMHHEITDTTEESDSDTEDIRKIAEKSQSQLVSYENQFLRSNGSVIEDCAEIECACRDNLRGLRGLLNSASMSLRGEKAIRDMIEKWEALSSRVAEAQRVSALYRDLAALRMEFKAAHDRLSSYEVVLESPRVLDERINQITAELSTLRERKATMLALNVSTHRLITDLGTSAFSTSSIFTALKDGVADLYRIWDETFQRGNERLCALQAVQQFGARLGELECALRRDKDTLAVLDVALEAGATTEVASSVRHVARLLSEKQDLDCQNGNGGAKEATKEEPSSLQEGGSLSDSGISDSGSELELSERERRLAALRRLTRNLENQLGPGSETLASLWKRVEDVEAELRLLQEQCRRLIVRTATSVEARALKRTAPGQPTSFIDKRRKSSSEQMSGEEEASTREEKESAEGKCGEEIGAEREYERKEMRRGQEEHQQQQQQQRKDKGYPEWVARTMIERKGGRKRELTDSSDPDREPGITRSWIWRILRAALPFQLALVVLLCAACLLEPHCCEAINSLDFSLTPQLRYVRGPPPV